MLAALSIYVIYFCGKCLEKQCGIYCIDRIRIENNKSASCLFHVGKMQILSLC